MMFGTTRALLFCCILGMHASSAEATRVDWIGIYFDAEAQSSCLVDSPFTPYIAYVLYSSPSVAAVMGYEFGVAMSPGVAVLSAHLPTGQTIADLGQVELTSVEPISCGPLTLFLEINFITQGSGASLSLVEASDPSSPGAGPAVILEDDSLISLDCDTPSAFIQGNTENCTGLAPEATTWGAIKGLYR